MKQRTIKKSVSSVGIGLHTGEPISLCLEPLEANMGIIFYRKDIDMSVKASPENVINTQMATVIGNEKGSISTIEHFISAVYAYGIDNLKVILDGPEVPVMDGSASSFCMMLDEAGYQELDTPKSFMLIKKEIQVNQGDKYTKISPSKNPSFDFTIHFDHVCIGKQSYKLEFSKQAYIKELSRARTFGFLRDVQYLKSKGLARGGSLDNAVVLDEKRILNPEGLRYQNEFVRHKILDAIGDLSLLNHPLIADYESFAGSHELNHKLTLAVLADEANYEILELNEEKTLAFQKALI